MLIKKINDFMLKIIVLGITVTSENVNKVMSKLDVMVFFSFKEIKVHDDSNFYKRLYSMPSYWITISLFFENCELNIIWCHRCLYFKSWMQQSSMLLKLLVWQSEPKLFVIFSNDHYAEIPCWETPHDQLSPIMLISV